MHLRIKTFDGRLERISVENAGTAFLQKTLCGRSSFAESQVSAGRPEASSGQGSFVCTACISMSYIHSWVCSQDRKSTPLSLQHDHQGCMVCKHDRVVKQPAIYSNISSHQYGPLAQPAPLPMPVNAPDGFSELEAHIMITL